MPILFTAPVAKYYIIELLLTTGSAQLGKLCEMIVQLEININPGISGLSLALAHKRVKITVGK